MQLQPAKYAAAGILEVFGDTDTGKTSFARAVGQQFDQTVIFDLEHKIVSGDEHTLLTHPEGAENTFQMLSTMVRQLPHSCFIVDSLPLLLLEEQRSYAPTTEPYLLTRLLVAALRGLVRDAYQAQSLVILINSLWEYQPMHWSKPLGRHYPLFCHSHLLLEGYQHGVYLGRELTYAEVALLSRPQTQNLP